MVALDHVGGARDEELLDHVAAGCEAALAELYGRHGGAVFSFTRRMAPDAGAAGDIVEEVFLELWEDRHAFDGRLGALRSHLLLLARRLTLARLGRDRPVAAAGARELASSTDLGTVEMALFGGRTCQQIADLLGTTEREVKRRLRRGLERVRSA